MRKTELRKVTVMVMAVLVGIAVVLSIPRDAPGTSRAVPVEGGTLLCGSILRG